MRADVYDSVHQMRVTTRKIRSLLQASEDAFGLTDDAWVLDELRQLASVLGIARDAEVLAERYASALDALPAELVRGPVRSGWSRGQPPLPGRPAPVPGRDALAAVFPVARRPGGAGVRAALDTTPAPSRTGVTSSTRPTSASARRPSRRSRPSRNTRTRRCIGSARAPSAFAMWPRPPGRVKGLRSAPRSSRRCWAITGQRGQPGPPQPAGRGRPPRR